MKSYNVVFTPEAEEQLAELYRYIADNASPEIAERYTGAVIASARACEAPRIVARAATTFARACGLRATGGEP